MFSTNKLSLFIILIILINTVILIDAANTTNITNAPTRTSFPKYNNPDPSCKLGLKNDSFANYTLCCSNKCKICDICINNIIIDNECCGKNIISSNRTCSKIGPPCLIHKYTQIQKILIIVFSILGCLIVPVLIYYCCCVVGNKKPPLSYDDIIGKYN